MMSVVVFGWDGDEMIRQIEWNQILDLNQSDNDEKKNVLYPHICFGQDFLILLSEHTDSFLILSRWDRSIIGERILSWLKSYHDSKMVIQSVCIGNSFAIFMSNTSVYYHQYFTLEKPMSLDLSVKMVACGSNHAIIQTDSTFFVIGSGPNGELGLGETKQSASEFTALPIPTGENPYYVAAGPHHTCFITKPHRYVYSFGCGAYYRLGHETDANHFTPKRIEALVGVGDFDFMTATTLGIKLISCGEWHTIAVSEGANDVYGWGWNKFGQLGSSSVNLEDHEEYVIQSPERIPIFNEECEEGIKMLTCGSTFSAFYTSSNRLLIMGKIGKSGAICGIDRDVSEWNQTYPGSLHAEVAGWTLKTTPDKGLFASIHLRECMINETERSSFSRKRAWDSIDEEEEQIVVGGKYICNISALYATSQSLAVMFL